jgi:Flp pilus assembly protein TadB
MPANGAPSLRGSSGVDFTSVPGFLFEEIPSSHQAANTNIPAAYPFGERGFVPPPLKTMPRRSTVMTTADGLPRVLPAHLYVDVPTIAKQASRLVFLVCLFALLIWAITGFVMIHPIIAIVTMIGCIGFYVMGSMTQKHLS